jgi:AmmeMemoRadiSam system protein B
LIEALLAEVPAPKPPAPKAVVAPHAGYVFSGAVAGAVLKATEQNRMDLFVKALRVSPEKAISIRTQIALDYWR